jgi:integral membrane sensor domain MASE1
MKQKIAFALIMGSITTGIISFTLIVLNIGFTDSFFQTWFRSWSISYLVVIPAILFVGPRVQLLVNRLFGDIIAEEETIL